MAQPKGKTGNPNGRPIGTPNKATTLAREAIAAFVEGNVSRLNGWLDTIASGVPLKDREGKDIYNKDDNTLRYKVKPDAQGAFDSLMSVIEYHIPKLARTEMTGIDGDPIDLRIADESSARASRIISEIAKAKADSVSEKAPMARAGQTKPNSP